jgi:hypothetical protein
LNNGIDYFVRAVSQGILVKVFVENLYKGFVEVKCIGERIIDVKIGYPPATIGDEMRKTIIAKMKDGACISGK